MKCQLLLVEELSLLELRNFFFFEITCFCQSAGGGIKSHPVTVLVFSPLYRIDIDKELEKVDEQGDKAAKEKTVVGNKEVKNIPESVNVTGEVSS